MLTLAVFFLEEHGACAVPEDGRVAVGVHAGGQGGQEDEAGGECSHGGVGF